MAQLKDTLIQGSARVTDTLYANIINTSSLNTNSLNANENVTLASASGDSPAIIFDRGGTTTDWKIFVTSGRLSFQSRTGTNAFTERGYFADNSGAFWASTHNGLTLTAASTGFTIAGGTTSKTLTVSDTVSLSGGSNQHLAVYGANNVISGSRTAYLIDESGSTVANKRNELVLGNNTASTTNGSAFGRLALYSQNTAGTYLVSASGTSWQTATLQAKTGTIAYTDDITTAIQGLDSTLPTGSATSKTLTALTITDGKMTAATFSDISIDTSQISSGTLTVARGGTGAASFTANSLIMSGNTTTAALTTRAIYDRTSLNALSAAATWSNSTSIPTMNTLAYWDGRYQTTSNLSNLKYCAKGEFGTIVTKSDTYYRVNTAPASGAWYAGTPLITDAGVMEIGKYIDFHDGNTSTADYNVRIYADSNNLAVVGDSNFNSIYTVGNIFAEKSIVAGQWTANTDQGQEYTVQLKGGAGIIYMYSQASKTGNRGIFSTNGAGTGVGILTVDTNNTVWLQQNTYLDGPLAIEKTGNNTSWVKGRDSAVVRRHRTADAQYVAAMSLIGTANSWDIGMYQSDIFYLTCIETSKYTANNNTFKSQIAINTDGNVTLPNTLYIDKWSTIADKAPAMLRLRPLQSDNSITNNGCYLAAYDDGDTEANGTVLVITSSGMTILGGGEAPQHFYETAVKGKTANANLTVGANAAEVKETTETCVIASDNSILFATNCGTIANRTLSYINSSGYFYATRVYGAVWNDYAEYRKQLYNIEAGRVVYDLDNGYILPTDKRLQPGAQVVSDTFGFAIGETDECKTPLAVTGRVLVYTYRDRYEYHAGDAVCSAPNGTVDIMTREEIKEYPDAIIGIVSEIPNYKTWGSSNVPINGRIWIKVR